MTENAVQAPRIWVLVSDKAGDNAQIEAVLARLGWNVEYRRLVFKKPFIKGKPPFLASLYHVDRSKSDTLEPPWPDFVLTIGRRPAMAAFWVRKRSGGRTKLVLFGRPKRRLANYAQVITPVQYALPDAPNVVKIGLPLMRIDERRLRESKTQWQARFADLPRPLIAVLVGGSTRPYVLDAAGARALIESAAAYCAGTGTLYVTTSRRTPAAAVTAIEQSMPSRGVLYKWSAGGGDNPYLGLLACADGFVVTGDSMSMITEVARLGRPLAIYALPRSPMIETLSRTMPASLAKIPSRVKYDILPRLGLTAFPRDLTRLHSWLYQHELAVPAGTTELSMPKGSVEDDLDRVADALRFLVLRDRNFAAAASSDLDRKPSE